ncbi:hypothetical protein DFH27DRAFT_566379, partial [Peziza echinospora]
MFMIILSPPPLSLSPPFPRSVFIHVPIRGRSGEYQKLHHTIFLSTRASASFAVWYTYFENIFSFLFLTYIGVFALFPLFFLVPIDYMHAFMHVRYPAWSCFLFYLVFDFIFIYIALQDGPPSSFFCFILSRRSSQLQRYMFRYRYSEIYTTSPL